MKRPVFFHHLQKTAGTSLHAAFVEEYGAQAVSPKLYGVTVEDALRTLSEKAVISGHLQVLVGSRTPRDRYCITVCREPVDRYLSHLFSTLRALELETPPRPIPRRWWDDVLDRESSGELALANFQVESLYRYGVESDQGLSPAAKLAAALAALDGFDAVGVAEELPELFAAIAFECGWDAVPGVKFENATAWRPATRELEGPVHARIASLNALDAQLWEAARERFARVRRRVLRAAVTHRRADAPAAEPRRGPEPEAPAGQPRRAAPASPGGESGSGEASIVDARLFHAGFPAVHVPSGDEASLRIAFECAAPIADLTLGIRIVDMTGACIFGANTRQHGFRLEGAAGDRFESEWSFRCALVPGLYRLVAALHPGLSHDARCFSYRGRLLDFEVVQPQGPPFEGSINLRPQLRVVSRPAAGGEIPVEPLNGDSSRAEGTSGPLASHAGTLAVLAAPASMFTDEIHEVEIEVRNAGGQAWRLAGPYPVRLSYHWLDEDGEALEFDGLRTPLPGDLGPGESARVSLRVRAPSRAGNAVLHISPVEEGVAWFHQSDAGPSLKLEVAVRE